MWPSSKSLAAFGPSTRARRLRRLRVAVRAERRRLPLRVRALYTRACGFGCRPGDIRLAYGWRRTVVISALLLALGGLTVRSVLSLAFVTVATANPMALVAFNTAVTVLALSVVTVHRRSIGRSARRRLPGWKRRLERWLWRHLR